jgi:hypothetical protein
VVPLLAFRDADPGLWLVGMTCALVDGAGMSGVPQALS